MTIVLFSSVFSDRTTSTDADQCGRRVLFDDRLVGKPNGTEKTRIKRHVPVFKVVDSIVVTAGVTTTTAAELIKLKYRTYDR